MNNRDIIVLGAIILVGAIAVELYTNFANPFIDYAPGTFTSLLTDTPQRFGYYKDGALIGTYTYTLTPQTGNSQTLYTLTTTIDATYQGSQLSLNTTHRFLGETKHVEYTVDTDIAGAKSRVECVFLGATAGVLTTSQGKNQTVAVTLPSNTVIIDNNDAAHWELLMKSFSAEAGKKYSVNVLVPQGAAVKTIEFGVDTAHQFVNIGSKSYECVVAREPNYEITLYFYQGNLIQYKNDVDGILIVKQMP
ncbi:MAG: hypothetical protein NTV61_07465 [Candidatus Bathyarchaeota archaeon]|nr:hypothetical protein [Candidatus Bathyarchaeota archaeon]